MKPTCLFLTNRTDWIFILLLRFMINIGGFMAIGLLFLRILYLDLRRVLAFGGRVASGAVPVFARAGGRHY